jgi:hypothetical protein
MRDVYIPVGRHEFEITVIHREHQAPPDSLKGYLGGEPPPSKD